MFCVFSFVYSSPHNGKCLAMSGRLYGQDANNFHDDGTEQTFRTPSSNGAVTATETEVTDQTTRPYSSCRAYVTVAILCLVNLLNYMDRFTIAGVLPDVMKYYNIDNTEGGLLQTSFVCSYMIFAPIFGYLGDRYSRKMIMVGGILFWTVTTLAGSFIPSGYFWAFLLCRGFVGVGEASYSTIAPTIIADLFLSAERSRMLAVFYFAIPVGSGLGYIVGANVAHAFGSWHWSLRVTPPLGVLCILLVVLIMKEPVRGESEGGEHLKATSWLVDLKELSKNCSFIWSTVGFTCVSFVAGALAWWGPSFLFLSIKVIGDEAPSLPQVSLIFGVITVIAGVVGVATGSGTSSALKQKYPRADPLICAFGLISSMPFLFCGAVLSQYSTPAAYVLIFVGETMLCLTWAIVADILMYVVIPTRRATAAAVQILLSHALGDAGSPYLIGMVSDEIALMWPKSDLAEFHSLQYALFITCFVNVLGGFSFLVTSWHVIKDKQEADKAIKGSCGSSTSGDLADVQDQWEGEDVPLLV